MKLISMSNNTQLATVAPKVSPLAVMAARFNADPVKLLETLKATVFKDARSNEELQALVIVANSYGLNPLTKELYAFPAKGGGIVPVVSIDGWVNLANSHPQMDGMDFEWEHDKDGKLVSCTCVVHRKDRGHPIRVTEYLSECKRNTEPWKMEHRMLRHKALCQAVRVAFGFSGIYDEDEAERISHAREVTPAPKQLSFDAPSTATIEPEVVTQDDSFNLDPTPPSVREQFNLLLNEHDITGGAALEKFERLTKKKHAKLADVPEAAIQQAVEDMETFTQL